MILQYVLLPFLAAFVSWMFAGDFLQSLNPFLASTSRSSPSSSLPDSSEHSFSSADFLAAPSGSSLQQKQSTDVSSSSSLRTLVTSLCDVQELLLWSYISHPLCVPAVRELPPPEGRDLPSASYVSAVCATFLPPPSDTLPPSSELGSSASAGVFACSLLLLLSDLPSGSVALSAAAVHLNLYLTPAAFESYRRLEANPYAASRYAVLLEPVVGVQVPGVSSSHHPSLDPAQLVALERSSGISFLLPPDGSEPPNADEAEADDAFVEAEAESAIVSLHLSSLFSPFPLPSLMSLAHRSKFGFVLSASRPPVHTIDADPCDSTCRYYESAASLAADSALSGGPLGGAASLYGRLPPPQRLKARYAQAFGGATGTVSGNIRFAKGVLDGSLNPDEAPDMVEYFREKALAFEKSNHGGATLEAYRPVDTPHPDGQPPAAGDVVAPLAKGASPAAILDAANAALSVGSKYERGVYGSYGDYLATRGAGVEDVDGRRRAVSSSDEDKPLPPPPKTFAPRDRGGEAILGGVKGRDLHVAVRYYEIACDLGSMEGCGRAGELMLILAAPTLSSAAKSKSNAAATHPSLNAVITPSLNLPADFSVQRAMSLIRRGLPTEVVSKAAAGFEALQRLCHGIPDESSGKRPPGKKSELGPSVCDAHALNGLGLAHLNAIGTFRDVNIAERLFREGADGSGNADANYNYGMVLLGLGTVEGHGQLDSMEAAMKAFTNAANKGHLLALHRVAVMQKVGFGSSTGGAGSGNCNAAAVTFKDVAEKSDFVARTTMEAFDSYKRGDYDRALQLNIRLAEMGLEVAQSNAAWMLENGHCPRGLSYTKCLSAALRYHKASALQGNAESSLRVGDFHYYDVVGKERIKINEQRRKDRIKAKPKPSTTVGRIIRWLRISGVLDVAVSCLQWIKSRYRDSSNDTNFRAAALHYQSAVKTNSPHAMYNLGYIYQHGIGVKQDFPLAKRYYDMAAAASTEAKIPIALMLATLDAHERLVKVRMKISELWRLVIGESNLEKKVAPFAAALHELVSKATKDAKAQEEAKKRSGTLGFPTPKAKSAGSGKGTSPKRRERGHNKTERYARNLADIARKHLIAADTFAIVTVSLLIGIMVKYRRWVGLAERRVEGQQPQPNQ